jgi:trans-2,3-dihydro-3-hydroxyanthranilate isomerase
MKRRFVTLDVFTATRLAGNPLAVVLDADGLSDADMLAITREFNLSETVFVFPPADKAHRARLRIFTPGRELPFAGHPTVGTAVLLATLDGGATSEFVLEEKVGPIRCRVRHGAGDAVQAEFDLTRLPTCESGEGDRDAMAAGLGLAAADLGLDGWPVESWSAGNPFTFVPVRSLDAIRRCRVDLARFEQAFGGPGRAAAFIFCREPIDRNHDFHARMFAPGLGLIEDPATGSAVAAFAGYLAAHGSYPDGERSIRVEQGYEMGRPSLIELRIKLSGGKLTAASIGGSAVIVSEGTLHAN